MDMRSVLLNRIGVLRTGSEQRIPAYGVLPCTGL